MCIWQILCCMPRPVYCNLQLSTGCRVHMECRGISFELESSVVSQSRSSGSSCWLPDATVLSSVSWIWLSFNWRISICSLVSCASWLCPKCTPSWQWVYFPQDFCLFGKSFWFPLTGKTLHGNNRSLWSVLNFHWFPSRYIFYTGWSDSN